MQATYIILYFITLYYIILLARVGTRMCVSEWMQAQTPTEGVLVATLQLDIAGLLAQAPNPALDFTGVIESALHFADNSVFVIY